MSVTHYRCASEVIAFTLFIQHKNAFHETMKKGEKTGEKKTIPKEMQTKAFFFLQVHGRDGVFFWRNILFRKYAMWISKSNLRVKPYSMPYVIMESNMTIVKK